MKTKQIHISNLGSFGSGIESDFAGYAVVHDSKRYNQLDEYELEEMIEHHRNQAVRNAARVELAERAVSRWQRN